MFLKDILFPQLHVPKEKAAPGLSAAASCPNAPAESCPKQHIDTTAFVGDFFCFKSDPFFFHHKNSPEVKVNSWASLYLALVCFGFLPLYERFGLKRFSFPIPPKPHPAPALLLQAAPAHLINKHLSSTNFPFQEEPRGKNTPIPFQSFSADPAPEKT